MIDWIEVHSNLEHQKEYLVTDGKRFAVAYLSKWVSLWYVGRGAGGRALNMKITHYAELNTPRGLDSTE